MSKIVKLEFKEQLYSFNLDGWFNATEAAGRFGKAPAEWLRLPSTLSYLAAFKRKYGEIPYLKTQRGAGGGTWLHPKLAVRFAQWLSDDFAVWCDEQIDAIIRNGIRAEGIRLGAPRYALRGTLSRKSDGSLGAEFELSLLATTPDQPL
ncbi:MAG: KilA-N domain-containing protein, partial [Comamonas sp.]|uniref:KilA-N domain-containing protein n=1 Tax=Comamonas sp. TaxID=34028 RepID=UPI00281791D5